MSKKDYSDLDVLIQNEIKKAPAGFMTIMIRLREVSDQACGKKGEGWRLIDRRLQAMRKIGLIKSVRNGRTPVWTMAEENTQ